MSRRTPPAFGLTRSAWINAWSLRRGLAPLGIDLRVAADVDRELPLPTLPADAVPDWLIFTEEASLKRALLGDAPPGARFWPRQFPLPLLDDKQAFADWLAQDADGPQGLPHWPLADWRQARFPVLLKARHSWTEAGVKLPRGWVCRDPAELAVQRRLMGEAGFDEHHFFLQQWLGDAPPRVLSVGGFFDAADEARHLAVVTDRVAGHEAEGGPSSSAMLVTVPDDHGLVARAARVLRRLGYTGPYELEFLLTGEGAGGQARVLELNPRFWMQHGLFGAGTAANGNGLLKRYLGLDTPADRAAPPPQRLLWVDCTWLLRRLLRGDRRPLATVRHWVVARGHGLVLCPSIGFVLRAALWRMLRRAGGGR